jgi:formylglycine-generating enzyme required for sulfatase activity
MTLRSAGPVLVLFVAAGAGCRADRCKERPAEAQIDVRLEGLDLAEVAATEVVITLNDARVLVRRFDVPAPSFVFEFKEWNQPPRKIGIRATAFDAKGRAVGAGEATSEFSPDGCNRFGVTVQRGNVKLDGRAPDRPRPDGPAACTHPAIVKSCTADACVVPAGCFVMGSPVADPCRQAKETEHQVTLTRKLEIAAREVTQEEFQALLGYNPSFFTACGTGCPVERVSWHEAAAYCNALSKKKGLGECYTCTGTGASASCKTTAAFDGGNIYACPGYRLPTEAEWEYAFRAGTKTAFYGGEVASCSGSDSIADGIAWYESNSDARTHPAGQKQPNPWGLHDMAGNVWEWCHDHYAEELGALPATDPVGPASGSERVLRGGSWIHQPRDLRAAARGHAPPTFRENYVGFRCATSQ